MSHYRGRRTHRRRGISPMALVMLAAIVTAAVVLIIIASRRGAPGSESQKPSVEDAAEAGREDPEKEPTQEDTPPEDTTPEPEKAPVARIEINGDIRSGSSVYCVGDTGYEFYTYVDSVAQKYAQCINQAADALAGQATVYDMILPLSSGITLPDELYGTAGLDDQQAAEKKAYSYMNDNVVTIPLYDAMMQHRTEYIYFRTDHHWTATGAYYAYRELCSAKGITPHELSEYTTWEFPGFLGSFYNHDKGLGVNPDTVVAYHPIGEEISMELVLREGGAAKTYEGAKLLYDESGAPAGNLYGTFLWGDNEVNGINRITNTALTDGSSCVVVKESFGNAFVPFLPDHYQTVYVIDYRYWNGSLTEFVKENGIQDVIFCNNIGAATRGSLVGNLHGIL